MSSSLDLLFFHFFDKYKIKKFKLSFRKNKENIEKDKMTFPIPDIVFKHGKDKLLLILVFMMEKAHQRIINFMFIMGKIQPIFKLIALQRMFMSSF